MKRFFGLSLRRMALPCMTAALVLCAAGIVRANSIYAVTLDQVGSNVVATGSGSIDLTGLTLRGPTGSETDLWPTEGEILSGSGSPEIYDGAFSGPTGFGIGGFAPATTGSGDFVGISISTLNGGLLVPVGYASGSALLSTAIWDNATFATLGATPGTYVWTWGTGANADSFTLDIKSPATSPTPECASFLLFGTGMVGLALAIRKHSRLRKRAARYQPSDISNQAPANRKAGNCSAPVPA